MTTLYPSLRVTSATYSHYYTYIRSPKDFLASTGYGSGSYKWIIHFQGGGWCYGEEECVERSKTALGSSKSWAKTAAFGGLLSPDPLVNPDFYNWNVAFLNYCDGASFSGDV